MNNEKLDNDIKNLKIKSLFSMYLTNVKYHYIKCFSLLVNYFKEFIIYFAGFIITLVLLPIGFLINLFTLIIVYFVSILKRQKSKEKNAQKGAKRTMLKIKEDKMQDLEKFGFKKKYSTYKFSADGKYNNRATLSISGCKQSTREIFCEFWKKLPAEKNRQLRLCDL